jgi:hypothetical protein
MIPVVMTLATRVLDDWKFVYQVMTTMHMGCNLQAYQERECHGRARANGVVD